MKSVSPRLSAPARPSPLATCGEEMYALIKDLFFLPRSLTGTGNRQTLQKLQAHIPLHIHEVPSGTPVLDWTIPDEWEMHEAYIANSSGMRIVDWHDSNLHVVQYSTPINTTLSLPELQSHLYSLPEHPDWIPYITSYYTPNWGFCLTDRQRQTLPDDTYHVVIDAEKRPGSLSYGELVIPGETTDEIVLSTYICHPSLANDNLSGIGVLTFLAKYVLSLPVRRFTYRLLFIPETIGAITWLHFNTDTVANIKHGLVVTCVGDPGPFTYKRSRRGNADIDYIVGQVLRESHVPYTVIDFFPWGSDERQFCSPGYDLPVGSLMRTMYGQFPEYHTSADNLTFIQPTALAESYAMYKTIIDTLDSSRTYVRTKFRGEPQLSKYNLYATLGAQKKNKGDDLTRLWVLNLADGNHSLLSIATRANLPLTQVQRTVDELVRANLLKET